RMRSIIITYTTLFRSCCEGYVGFRVVEKGGCGGGERLCLFPHQNCVGLHAGGQRNKAEPLIGAVQVQGKNSASAVTGQGGQVVEDRKSTRLNSSHVSI